MSAFSRFSLSDTEKDADTAPWPAGSPASETADEAEGKDEDLEKAEGSYELEDESEEQAPKRARIEEVVQVVPQRHVWPLCKLQGGMDSSFLQADAHPLALLSTAGRQLAKRNPPTTSGTSSASQSASSDSPSPAAASSHSNANDDVELAGALAGMSLDASGLEVVPYRGLKRSADSEMTG